MVAYDEFMTLGICFLHKNMDNDWVEFTSREHASGYKRCPYGLLLEPTQEVTIMI